MEDAKFYDADGKECGTFVASESILYVKEGDFRLPLTRIVPSLRCEYHATRTTTDPPVVIGQRCILLPHHEGEHEFDPDGL